QHLGLDLEPVAEQDHDQRDDGEVRDEVAGRVDVEHAQPALPEGEPGEHEQGGQRHEAAPRDPRDERAEHEQPSEDRERGLHRGHRGTVSDVPQEGAFWLKITVLGKSPAWQDADGACSGYLVEEEGACLLLDCGNGVFSKLRRFRDYTKVDAVVISHLHADHFLDLVPFAYALLYAPR